MQQRERLAARQEPVRLNARFVRWLASDAYPLCRRLAWVLLLGAPLLGAARAEMLDASTQKHLREAVFEVVMKKPEFDPLTYEKPLPLELLPYEERTGKYTSIGTAFAIAHGRFATAAHVIMAGMVDAKATLSLRDQGGKIYPIDRIVKFSGAEDYAVFTLIDAPRVTPLDTHDRPPLNDPVFAVGNALGQGIVIRDGLYTSDTPEEREGRWEWLRFSAAASPGNSGGPLVDRKGRVIGIVIRKSPSENLNMAVAVEQMLKGGEDAATLEERSTYRFALMRASDTTDARESVALPKSIGEFYAALQSALLDANHKIHADYIKAHGDRMFPHGADSQELLHSLYTAAFPRLIEERTDGIWGVTDPKPQRSQLDQNGFVELAQFQTALLARLRMPDDVKWPDFYANSKQFMDYLLKGLTLRRAVGSDSVRVTSLGSATRDTTYLDAYGRTWQLRTWAVPYNYTMIVSIALPTPQGYVGLIAQRSLLLQPLAMEDLQTLTNFVYLSFTGTLKQWREYMAASVEQPAVMRTLALEADYGKSLTLHSKRFSLVFASGLPKVAPESVLTLKFSYYPGGDAAVWDVAGVWLEDPEQKGNWFDITRRQRPQASLPEGFTERWHTLVTGAHPYTGSSYATNGGTRIDAVQDFKEVSAGHRSIAYTIAVAAEGTQDQPTMKRALDALQRGLQVIEAD